MQKMNAQMLTGSELRTKLLYILQAGPQPVAVLSKQADIPAPHVIRALKPLIDDESVIRTSSGYMLTNTGRIQSMILRQMEDGLKALEEQRAFWIGHDLDGIPQSLQLRMDQLIGGKCFCGVVDDPLQSQTAFIDAVRDAKQAWGVSPLTAPGYEEMIFALLERGADVKMILAKSVIGKLNQDAIKAALAYENFKLFALPVVPKIGFTVTERLVTIALFRLNGRYDPQQDLVVQSSAAVEWGRELFDYYLRQALPVMGN